VRFAISEALGRHIGKMDSQAAFAAERPMHLPEHPDAIPGPPPATTPQPDGMVFSGWHPDIDTGAIWAALVQDTTAHVLILDPAGVLVFANRPATRLLQINGRAPLGRPLYELFGREYAAERLALLRRVLDTGRPESLLCMVRGVLLVASYRPLRRNGVYDQVLKIAQPIAHGTCGGMLAALPPFTAASINDLGPLSALSERELEVLYHIGKGRSSEEIATVIHRSTKTVEWHRVSLGAKLGCASRLQLALIATRSGLTALEPADLPRLHLSGRPVPLQRDWA